jgi:hypothetical protein
VFRDVDFQRNPIGLHRQPVRTKWVILSEGVRVATTGRREGRSGMPSNILEGPRDNSAWDYQHSELSQQVSAPRYHRQVSPTQQ